MAKELPYFKFDAAEWINGLITLEGDSAQGLFTNICAHYWFKSGKLRLSEIKRRLSKSKPEDFKSLIDNGIIKISNDFIKISFLDIQLTERKVLSKTNSQNGRLGGRPKSELKAVGLSSVSELKANESNIEEKREEEREIHSHGTGKHFVTIAKRYANEKIQKIYSLGEYYSYTNQIYSLKESGWVFFDDFVKENSGKVFNEPDHLYNTFRNFCRDYKPPNLVDIYKDAQWDKDSMTPEAWEDLYSFKLKHDGEFRKRFGYVEQPNGQTMGKLNSG